VCSSDLVIAADANSGGVVMVEINGKKITLGEFEEKHPMALFPARTSFFQAEQKVVDSFVDEYLLDEQARKENVTVDQLLERHVNATIAKDPSEEALKVYYEGVDTKEPYEAVRGKIVDALRQRRLAKAKTAYLESLRKDAKIVMRVGPPRVEVSMKDTEVRGPRDAKVLLVEYADYECPYCQQMQPTLDRIESEFKGQLAFAYKDVPLPMHPDAPKAAEATHCAGAQGKYWDYHDLLVKNKQLEIPALKEAAKTLKLDTKAFDQCLDSGKENDILKEHTAEAAALGVTGTPSFLINGRYFEGVLTYEQLRAIVEDELGGSPKTTAAALR
jgi:protein-disulfide isomerase